MTSGDIVGRISDRVGAAGLESQAVVSAGCAAYLSLLARWNRRINLTALPLLDPIPNSAIDKLIVEPLVAAELFPPGEPVWFDLGSGGGSPAIPLRIARPSGSLTMVESRERKCAFLREAVRVLNLKQTEAVAVRFEALRTPPHPADIVTLRAVRVDSGVLDLLSRLLVVGGHVFCFGSAVIDQRFVVEVEKSLPDNSKLFVLRRIGV